MGSPVPPEAPFTYAYLARFAFLGVVKRIHAPMEASVYLASSAQPATSAIQVIIRIASPLMTNVSGIRATLQRLSSWVAYVTNSSLPLPNP